MSEIAIRSEGLGKRYRLGQTQQYKALRDVLSSMASAPAQAIRRRLNATPAPDTGWMWALKEVSFDIHQGDVVGIIGHNGAGKSTLLKILSRITTPTVGFAEVHGRVGSLLEIGTGFHPELSGRENVFLSGATLGMKRAEIARKFDEIVAFAEMETFIDTTVKHYSLGMYMRLAFAVAAHLEPEILIVDEVLAVGDASFQKRCLGKMGDVARSGRTVLFVSHNLDSTQRLCTHGMLFDHGELTLQGDIQHVIEEYIATQVSRMRPNEWIDLTSMSRVGTGEVRFAQMRYSSLSSDYGFAPYPNGPLEFAFDIESDGERSARSLGVIITNQLGTRLINADTALVEHPVALRRGTNRLRLRIDQLALNPGLYRVGMRVGNPISARPRSGMFDYLEFAFEIEVVAPHNDPYSSHPNAAVTCDFSVEVNP